MVPDFDINWLYFLLDLSYFKQKSPTNAQVIPEFAGILQPTDIIVKIPVKTDLTTNIKLISIQFGPKIALLASDAKKPWETNHLYISGGGSFYNFSRERTLTLTILDPNLLFEATRTNQATLQDKQTKNILGSYFAVGTSFQIFEGMHILVEWKRYFGIGASNFSGGLGITF